MRKYPNSSKTRVADLIPVKRIAGDSNEEWQVKLLPTDVLSSRMKEVPPEVSIKTISLWKKNEKK